MTNDHPDGAGKVRQDQRPFLLLFAEPLPESRGDLFRYDKTLQRSEVLIGGTWVQSTATGASSSGTRITRVQQETTDDC